MPLIGLLSDTHGHAERAAAALRLLRGHGAELFLHLGDIGPEPVLEELAGHPVRVVFGNCDDEWALARHAGRLGIVVDHPMGRLELDGRRVAYTHGHIEHLMQEALRDRVDWLLHGHSHVVRDEMIGSTRVVNPGALHRAPRLTVALLEPAQGRFEVLEVAR